MKTKIVTLSCVLALGFGAVRPAWAMDDGSPEAVAADVLVARPACLAATVVGSAVFVLALPFAAMTKSVKKTGRVLVGGPAKATFTRDLGDFTELTRSGRATTQSQ
jgi:hypothetical protein